jgi:DNA-binding LacI/PurR family transcriptional regulator
VTPVEPTARSQTARVPVMVDVARLAGVSQKTVSRVVNDSPNVRAEVRERVRQAIADLGYRPNAAARALVTRRTRVLGIITPGTALYGPSAQLFGLERAAWERGYSVVIISTHEGTVAELVAAVDRLVDHGVDGLVLGAPLTAESVPAGVFRGIPTVTVGDPLSAPTQVPAVVPDQAGGARTATRHLLDLGHVTVHHVAGPTSWISASERHAGWREALEEAAAPVPAPIVGDWSSRAGYEAGRALAERHDVTAVFAANDHMAIGLLRALGEVGRSVPSDVAVVGFDDVPEAQYLCVPLSTIRQDFTEITGLAVERLLHDVEGGGEASAQVVVPSTLVVRASSGTPR